MSFSCTVLSVKKKKKKVYEVKLLFNIQETLKGVYFAWLYGLTLSSINGLLFFEVHFLPLATICHGKIRLAAWHTASASAISAPQQEKVLFS